MLCAGQGRGLTFRGWIRELVCRLVSAIAHGGDVQNEAFVDRVECGLGVVALPGLFVCGDVLYGELDLPEPFETHQSGKAFGEFLVP